MHQIKYQNKIHNRIITKLESKYFILNVLGRTFCLKIVAKVCHSFFPYKLLKSNGKDVKEKIHFYEHIRQQELQITKLIERLPEA